MRTWVVAIVLAFAVLRPTGAFAKDAKLARLRDSDPKPAAKAPLTAKPTPKKHAAKRVVKKAPVRKKTVAKSKSKPKHHDDDDDDDDDAPRKQAPEIRPMP